MQLTTILNRVEKYKSFVYVDAKFCEDDGPIEVRLRPRKGNRPVCSGCRRAGPIYDHQSKPRRFEFVPLWQMAVVFVSTMRRVDCPMCGAKIEAVPWCEAKHRPTKTDRWFLAHGARRLPWQAAARVFGTS